MKLCALKPLVAETLKKHEEHKEKFRIVDILSSVNILLGILVAIENNPASKNIVSFNTNGVNSEEFKNVVDSLGVILTPMTREDCAQNGWNFTGKQFYINAK